MTIPPYTPDPNAPVPIVAPIPDVNHNGILDGKDILAALERESAGRDSIFRSPQERAHGVLKALKITETALQYQEFMKNAPTATLQDLAPVLDATSLRLTLECDRNVTQINHDIAANPDLREVIAY